MTGYDIYESAMKKLGLFDMNGSIEREAAFKAAALDAVNEIGFDLFKMKPIEKLTDETAVDQKGASAFSYGVAMLLSVLENDAGKNVIMTAIYNARRAAYLSEISHIKTDPLYKSEG